jgi:hypothetical protein
MKRFVSGALAGLAAATLLAAPALAGPANVTVRVEGESQTLVPRTTVRTTTVPPVQHPTAPSDPANSCNGTTAMGAVGQAVAGDFAGSWGDLGFLLERIKGETQTAPSGADPARYWSFWVNYEAQNQGLCKTELQEGDDVLVFADCFSQTARCESLTPLRISGVPATATPGQSVPVKLEEFVVTFGPPPNFEMTTTAEPADGATVTAGAQSVATGADGIATLTMPQSGPVSIAASKPGRVRTAAITCVSNGSDGNCGAQLPSGTPLGTERPDDKTAPVATISGLKRGQVFSRKRAPRTLRGTVSADPSGIKSVRLSILRKRGGRCWAFDGASERFKRHRCGGSRSFRIGDRAEWSYLLPNRLPRGRYTIRVIAIDNAGNDSATETRIRVK